MSVATPATHVNHQAAALAFLRALWPDPVPGYLLLWTLPDKLSAWYPVADLDRMADDAIARAAGHNVYLGCALSPADYGPGNRCKKEDAAGIPGLWADIDFASPAHKKENLPPTIHDALTVANAMPLPPSLIVHSGHGLYPWWLLSRPWIFADAADRAAAAALLCELKEHLQRVAAASGWTCDSTHDLARVLRLPGTVNRKAEPVPVTCDIPDTIRRYDAAELRDALKSASRSSAPAAPPASPKAPTEPPVPTEADNAFLALADLPPEQPRPALPPMTDDQLIARAKTAKNGQKFCRLWDGDATGYPSASEAELALVSIIAYWCGDDAERIERIMGMSALGKREKWTERADIRRRAIDKAMSSQVAVGNGKASAAANHKQGSSSSSSPQPSGPSSTSSSSPPPPRITLDDLTLIVTGARRSPSRLIKASVLVLRDREKLDELLVSSATSNRVANARQLAKHLKAPEDLKIDSALSQLVTLAGEVADAPKVRQGETVSEMVKRIILENLQPKYKTAPGGIWCEAIGAERQVRDIRCDSEMMEAASNATDAPFRADGVLNRAALKKLITAEIEIFFADLLKTLPQATDADLGEHSAAAQEFKNAVVRLMTTCATWEKSKDGDARRASLISRVKSATKAQRIRTRGWVQAIDAVACWWRVEAEEEINADGEVSTRYVPYIAIRVEVAHQMTPRVILPGVFTQTDLTTLGGRYGVVEKNPSVPSKVSGGKVGIAVLKRSFVDDLLGAVGDFEDAPAPAAGAGQSAPMPTSQQQARQQALQAIAQAQANGTAVPAGLTAQAQAETK